MQEGHKTIYCRKNITYIFVIGGKIITDFSIARVTLVSFIDNTTIMYISISPIAYLYNTFPFFELRKIDSEFPVEVIPCHIYAIILKFACLLECHMLTHSSN